MAVGEIRFTASCHSSGPVPDDDGSFVVRLEVEDAAPGQAACTLSLVSDRSRVRAELISILTEAECSSLSASIHSVLNGKPPDAWVVIAIKASTSRGSSNMMAVQGLVSRKEAERLAGDLAAAALLMSARPLGEVS